ncbi:hypothetical protein [Rhodococcus sp. B10]|uniref:hypothetical protein n=1 Tax=Rhodococcus sp. B10 TaxID=2695876 RepID=UPI00143138BE|nr:hypothetical protein [Rhodococcus sp. B10]NIL77172.1 hypothetical protein [Rhodococcus sp. B10]
MKLSKKQQLDLDTIMYYYESDVVPTGEDIAAYFAWSDRGDKTFQTMTTPGAERLRWGKTYRELQVTSYLEDWGDYITAVDLASEEPEFICEWLSKVMKKPAIISMWRMFNATDTLTQDDIYTLRPLALLSRGDDQ